MNTEPYIVAEISANHNGELSRALKLMEEIKEAGAHAIKLQTYTADTLTLDARSPDFMIEGGPWDGYSLYGLYQKAHTPWEWHEALFKKARALEIDIFSTPFDESAVDFLETLSVPRYKVASFELSHLPLIAYMAQTRKPLILSTGASSLEEITEAVDTAVTNGCTDVTLLHCISEYPSPPENYNLNTMIDLKERFPACKIGLSDHSLGTTVAIAAVALGATLIEKHVTLKRSDGGPDAAFSLEPAELSQLCKHAKEAYLSLGKVLYTARSLNEARNGRFRRSIYAVKAIPKGEPFSKDNIRVIRPGHGLAPKHYNELIGHVAPRDFLPATPLRAADLEALLVERTSRPAHA